MSQSQRKAAGWVAGGVLGTIVWVALLDGFAAGALVVLTLAVTMFIAYVTWTDL